MKSKNEIIQNLLEKQYEMQETNHKKRPVIVDPTTTDVVERINAAMYYWNCMNAEYYEMCVERKNLNREKMQEEYIDILHFILSVIIFLDGMRIKDWEVDIFLSRVIDLDSLWSNVCQDWGNILNDLPYKNWKTYDFLEYHSEIDDIKLKVFLNDFLIIGEVLLNMSLEVIEEKYMEKWEINRQRQQKGGRYEK